jgi:hypothetical protein
MAGGDDAGVGHEQRTRTSELTSELAKPGQCAAPEDHASPRLKIERNHDDASILYRGVKASLGRR